MQFQFHPQFLVLFCHTNTLEREKKREGQGLMVNLSKKSFEGKENVPTDILPKHQFTYVAEQYFQIFITKCT